MPLGLGATKGLSFVNDWEKDIDRVYQNAEYAAKVEAKKEQETLWFAEKLKKGHGSTPYVEGKLNTFYKRHMKKIADFAINNPNFRTDVTKMQEFQSLADELLINPILQQDLQVKQNFERLQAAVASGQITASHFAREEAKYKAYANADPETEADPYVFENPKIIDPTKLIDEAQAITKPIEYEKVEGNLNVKYHGIDPIASLKTANSQYAIEDNKIVIDKEYAEALKTDPNIKTLYSTPQSYWSSRIEAGNTIRRVGSDYDQKYLKSLEVGNKADVPGRYFMKNEYWMVKDLKDGETAPGTAHSLALTLFGGKESAIVTPADGILVESKYHGGYRPLDVSVQMEAINFKSYKSIAGKLYGIVDVNSSTAIIKDGKKISQGNPGGIIDPNSKYKSVADSTLTDWGFNAVESKGTGQMAMFSTTPGKEYSGTILVPIKMGTTNLVDYDKSVGGLTEAKPATDFYGSPEIQQELYNTTYKRRADFINEKGSSLGVSFVQDINDPEFIKQYGYGFARVKYKGKETDDKGNPYIYNHETGSIQTYIK